MNIIDLLLPKQQNTPDKYSKFGMNFEKKKIELKEIRKNLES